MMIKGKMGVKTGIGRKCERKTGVKANLGVLVTTSRLV